jgi:hypothetical protein
MDVCTPILLIKIVVKKSQMEQLPGESAISLCRNSAKESPHPVIPGALIGNPFFKDRNPDFRLRGMTAETDLATATIC